MKELQILLSEPRMFDCEADRASNNCIGLLPLVEKALTKDSVMVELGSFGGVSTDLFARYAKKVYAVDLWATYNERLYQETMQKAESLFDEILKYHSNITKVRGDSLEIFKDFEDASVDFVYIDSLHTYEHVKKEIENWLPKIKKTGYIGGHDYTEILEVNNAVREFFQEDIIEVFDDSSWLVKL